ncbi:low temperature requirement protein A [Micromonospora sp. NPDC007230]|uniref:low temperature requirement protein A n=1 Tax=Micromonospora sp. NPDC007230 TaxID=3364237 RepID=UPI0036B3443C
MVGRSIAGEHLAERYQQFLLIALGESILTIGFTLSGDAGFTRERTIGFALAMLTTVQFWRIYFFRAGHLLPLAITSAREPVRLGIAASFTHLVMVAGIILTGAGYELFIDHPLGHTVPAWLFAILGGPALFLVGRASFEFEVFSRISRSWVAGLLALGLLTPAMLFAPPLAAGGVATAVLFGVVVLAELRAHGEAPEKPTPPI